LSADFGVPARFEVCNGDREIGVENALPGEGLDAKDLADAGRKELAELGLDRAGDVRALVNARCWSTDIRAWSRRS
jgi:hypothetical protein|tara:strand:+ start:4299 stop:4526 length:228 start_codon:yes stop_codon:yes gene_type:complete